MQDSDIYVKTEAGRDEIRARALGLPMSVRAILLMVDGQRSVSSMRSLIAGSKAPVDVLDTLAAQGLIERRGGVDAIVAPAPPAPPPAPTVAPPPMAAPPVDDAVVATTRREAPTAASVAPPAMRTSEPVLDLVLPTIHGPLSDELAPPAAGAPPLVAAGGPPSNAYEHLYAMMNEIVRDFLAPHRRYFFQLKIERCGTAEELLELLHGLQTALAKSRGDAFASDVIARLRSAAA